MLSEPELCRRLSEIAGSASARSTFWGAVLRGAEPPYHSLEEFARRVPRVDKQLLFSGARQVTDGIGDGDPGAIQEVLSSSGTSGDLRGFSLLGGADLVRITGLMDRFLESTFDVGQRPTLVLSALPNGVRVPTTKALSVYAGTRPDTAHSLLLRLREQVGQVLIVAEPLYAKQLLEYLHARGYPLRSEPINLIVGGYYLPENLRDYLGWLLGVRLDRQEIDSRCILSTFGVGEVGLHLLFETHRTVALRRFMRDRPRLIAKLCGEHLPTAPMVFAYEPDRVFVEAVDGRLVFSMLEDDRLQPVLRYDTGDWGGFISAHDLRENLPTELLHLVPEDGTPLVWQYGRRAVHWTSTALLDAPRTLEAVFSDARRLWTPSGPTRGPALQDADSPSRLLASITGHFTLRGHGVARASERNTMRVRLVPPRPSRETWERFEEAMETAPLPASTVKKRLAASLDVAYGRRPGAEEGAFSASVNLDTVGYFEHPKGSLGLLWETKPRFLRPGPSFRRAWTGEDRERIFRLRHHVFVTEEGLSYDALGASADARIVRDDADNTAAHFLAEVGGKVVGALRIVSDFAQFEDAEDFDFDGWTYDGSGDDPEFKTYSHKKQAPYGVRFRRDRVGLVGRICVSRAYRGAHLGVAEGLIQMGIKHLVTSGKAAVFLDCSDHHVQRYQAGGFVEYKPPYLHRVNGQRYHTLIAVIDAMEFRREEMWDRTADIWPKVWALVLSQAFDQPPPFRNPLDLLLWADLLDQAAHGTETHPLMPPDRIAAGIQGLHCVVDSELQEALAQRVQAILAETSDAGRIPQSVIQEATGAAMMARGMKPSARAARLLMPLLAGAARSKDPRTWLATPLASDLPAKLAVRLATLMRVMTIPKGVPDHGEGPARVEFIYARLRDAALQVLWHQGRREDAIALTGWYRHLAMVAQLGGDKLHRKLLRREVARDAMAAMVKQSVRAPVVGSPFLRRARALSDGGGRDVFMEGSFTGELDTMVDSNSSEFEPVESITPWIHHRYVALEEAFKEEDGAFVTDPKRVVYVSEGRVDLLPLDGGDEVVWTAKAGEILGAAAALAGSAARFRARARGTVSLGEIESSRFHAELRRDPHLSLSLVRELVLGYRARAADGRTVYGLSGAPELTKSSGVMPERLFRELAEGLVPAWREPGAALYRYGDFADAVYLVEWGQVIRARGRVELPLHSTSQEMAEELARLEESLRDGGKLLPDGGHRRQVTGCWPALLPLDDPSVSGSRGRGRQGTPAGTGVRGAAEGARRRGPQPERHELTALVGPSGAMVYTLPREELILRLEANPTSAYELGRLLARRLALVHGAVEPVTTGATLPDPNAQLLRNTFQLSNPPSPKANA